MTPRYHISELPKTTDQPVIEVTMPIGTHTLDLVVVDSDGLRSSPTTVTITVRQDPPVLNSINPTSGIQDTTGIPVTISGQNLFGATAVTFDPSDGTSDGITAHILSNDSDTELLLEIDIASGAATSDRKVTVTTPGGTSQEEVHFTVEPATPFINSISPTNGTQGAQALPLTISGRHLTGANSVTFSGSGVTAAIQSGGTDTTLPVEIDIATSAAPGSRTVTVTTPGGTAQSPVDFTVESAQAPVISLNPSSGLKARDVITISGTNFTPLSNVLVTDGLVSVTANADSSGSWRETLRISSNRGPGNYQITATDDNGLSASATYTVESPVITLDRSSGAPGSALAISGTFFSSFSRITIELDGNNILGSRTLSTDANGSFTVTDLTVPQADPGVHAVIATDAAGNSASASFTVLASGFGGPPFRIGLLSSIYDSLLNMAEDGTVVPALAETWTISNDLTEVTLKLREGVRFHDGTPLTSDAFKYNFGEEVELIPGFVRPPLLGNQVRDVEAIDELTVNVVLRAPLPLSDLIRIFGGVAGMIASPRTPGRMIGAGPFQVSDFVANQRLILKAFDGYWAGQPEVDSLELLEVPESATRLAMLLTGEAQVIVGSGDQELSDISQRVPQAVICGSPARFEAAAPDLNATCYPDGALRIQSSVGLGTIRVALPSLSTFQVIAPDDQRKSIDVASGIEPLGNNLLRVMHFNNNTQEWETYDTRPEFADINTLTELVDGEVYWVEVRNDQRVALNNQTRDLTTAGGANQIVW